MIAIHHLFDNWAATPIQPPVGPSDRNYQKIIDRNLKKGDDDTLLLKGKNKND